MTNLYPLLYPCHTPTWSYLIGRPFELPDAFGHSTIFYEAC